MFPSRRSCPSRPSCLFLAAFIFSFSGVAAAQRPIVTPHYDAPVAEITDAIAALLGTGGDRVAMSGETMEFWWVKSLPLKSGTSDVSWSSVNEGMLFGAVQMSGRSADARGTAIKPGTYTLRYENEPARKDGPARPVLLLLPAAADSSTSAVPHDTAISLSRQVSITSNPAVFVVDPNFTAGDPRVIRRAGRQTSVLFRLPVSRDGADAGTFTFGLVLSGAERAEKH